MLMDEEGMQDTANNLIHIGKPIELDEEKFMQQLEELKEYVVTEPEDIRECVKKLCRRITRNWRGRINKNVSMKKERKRHERIPLHQKRN